MFARRLYREWFLFLDVLSVATGRKSALPPGPSGAHDVVSSLGSGRARGAVPPHLGDMCPYGGEGPRAQGAVPPRLGAMNPYGGEGPSLREGAAALLERLRQAVGRCPGRRRPEEANPLAHLRIDSRLSWERSYYFCHSCNKDPAGPRPCWGYFRDLWDTGEQQYLSPCCRKIIHTRVPQPPPRLVMRSKPSPSAGGGAKNT